MEYNFEWDIEKARLNFIKHKISFEQACYVFRDPKAITIFDKEHSEKEDRWITIGISPRGNIIVVCHTFEKTDKDTLTTRIISSRKGTKREQEQYKEE
jgi:uncharacterized DUF497 family protein